MQACCLGLIALSAPRLVILAVVFFSDYIGEAYRTTLWPFLGFLFLPLTTLAYAWAVHAYGGAEGLGLVAVVVAMLVDLGLVGSNGPWWRERAKRRSAES